LNKHYDAQLPSFMLTYSGTIYFGHTKEEVVNKVIEEMGEKNDLHKQ